MAREKVKSYNTPVTINFETGECIETFDSLLAYVHETLSSIPNAYHGNKRKLIGPIFRAIEDSNIRYDRILDLFSGSGIVSMAAKMLGKTVVTNDLMSYPYCCARAFVKNNDEIITPDDINYLLNCDPYQPKYSFVEDNYVGDRFSLKEARTLDRYYNNIIDLFGSHPVCGSMKSTLAAVHLLHYVSDRCFLGGRLNNGQVIAQIDHRINHDRNQGQQLDFKDINTNIISSPKSTGKHTCFNMDALSFLIAVRPDVDVAYMDPPYGGDQSDYCKMYSFFESYLHHMPIEELDHLKKSNNFASKKDYYIHFKSVLEAASYIPNWVISFNDKSWCCLDDIESVVKEFRGNVRVNIVEHDRKYSKGRKSLEYIIVAKK
jgi:adenine-specific DNA methylase